MERQEKIEKEKIVEDDELDMKEFVKDIRDMKQRLNYATGQVQTQDQKLVQVNEKLEGYNKEVNKGDKYLDIINRGPIQYLKDTVTWLFSWWGKKQSQTDKKIIEDAKNPKNNNDGKDSTQCISGKTNGEDDMDAILDEALNETIQMRKAAQGFRNAVNNSNKVVDVTNSNMDHSLNNVDRVNKKMKK